MSDNETLDWNSLGNTRVGEIEPPKGLPDGHYAAIIIGAGKAEPKGQKKTLCLTFPIRLTEPLADVDSEAFAASDGFKKDGYELNFWLTPNSLFRFTEFGKALGGSDDMSIPELAEHLATCGEAFAVSVKQQASQKNPSRTFQSIDDPIPLADFQG